MSQVSEEHETDDLFDLPPLPATVVMSDGQVIDISSSVWRGRASVDVGKYTQINWSSSLEHEGQRSILTKRAWYLVKLYLADRLSKRKMITVVTNYWAFLAFSRWFIKQDTSVWLVLSPEGF